MWILARIARGQTNRLTSGVTSPLQGAGQQILHVSPLKRGRDPGSQTMCLTPGYPGKVCTRQGNSVFCFAGSRTSNFPNTRSELYRGDPGKVGATSATR